MALVVLRHSKDLFLPFNDVENERQRPADNRLHPHELVAGSEYLYRSVRPSGLAKYKKAFVSVDGPLCLTTCRRNMHLHLVAGGGVQGNWFVAAHMTEIFVDFVFLCFAIPLSAVIYGR